MWMPVLMSMPMIKLLFCGFPHTHNFNIKIERDAGQRIIQGVIGINGDFITLDFFTKISPWSNRQLPMGKTSM